MKRHCRDYEASDKDVHVTLCGIPLDPDFFQRLMSTPQQVELAFSWAPIKRINCPPCKKKRKKLERTGKWPD